MASPDAPDTLRRHQEAALGVLTGAVECLEHGQAAVLADGPRLRAEMAAVLRDYQIFKHECIFDPAIESGDEHRAALARHMKIGCIAAGEIFRTYMNRWNAERIAADWVSFKPAARLTINQLRRHIVGEGEGIAELIATYR